MTTKNRIASLEAKMITIHDAPPIKIGRFIVSPENLYPDQFECDGEVFTRFNDETHKEFRTRCINRSTWAKSNENQRKIFMS